MTSGIDNEILPLIFEYTGYGMVLVDQSSFIIRANSLFLRITGYERSEIEGVTKWMELVDEKDLPRLNEAYNGIEPDHDLLPRIHEFSLKKKDGTKIHVAATITVIAEKGLMIASLLDITEKKQATQSLRRRDATLDAINSAAGSFLTSADWKEEIKKTLKMLGEATGVSRVYLFENTKDPETKRVRMNIRSEWTATGVEGQIDNPAMQDLSYTSAGVGEWKNKLSIGRPVFFDISKVDARERENMEKLGVRSSVIVPVCVRDRWWGYIGFDDMEKERIWSEAEIDTLGAAAGILGAAIHRQETDSELLLRDATLDAINSAAGSFLKADDWKEEIKDTLKMLGEATEVSRVYLFENTIDHETNLTLMNIRSEWTATGVEGQIDNPAMQGLSYTVAGVRDWKDKLSIKKPVFFDISKVDAKERENMEKLGVRSSVIVPVCVRDRWWGYIGFDDMEEERIWSDAEVDTLGAAAGILGAAIQRQETDESLLAYINEATLRIKEPVSLVNENLTEIADEISRGEASVESVLTRLMIQVRNTEQISENLHMLNVSIVEKRNEIPDAFRQFIRR